MNTPSDLRQPLQAAIAALQSRRGLLGDALVDAALVPLLERLATLTAQPEPAQVPEQPVRGIDSEPSRRLRQVSVLFLDIVGSTQLIQLLDPEEVQSVVDGALAAFTAIVTQHGGEVLRYAGDSLKVAFGAHDTVGTREDDAERAVHCGLALLAEAARRGDDIKRLHGFDGFNARVGIHTGGVVRGGGVENDKSLSGLAVNIAARLEQATPAGTLCISVDTYRQVQGRFDVQAQPTLQLKGLQEPMQNFLVRGKTERRLRGLHQGVEGASSALVGRDAEFAQLRALVARVFTQGGLGAATVVGEAGLGKSRLLAELLAEVQTALPADVLAPSHTAVWWFASSHPQGTNQPCGLLRDLLFWHHGVKDSDTQAQAQQSFAAALVPIFGAAAKEQTALLGQLIGLDYSASPYIAGILRDGKQLRARGFHALAQYLQLQASQQPLVWVLDDLQWADDESLDAIDHIAAVCADLPLLLLCGARPELLQRRPDWGTTWPAHQRLLLEPLGEPARQALAGALLQRLVQPAPRLQALLSAQAAGNPFYMEALLQMLLDTGVIQTQADPADAADTIGAWQVQDSQLQTLQVPTTLVAVLQATLDALKPGERQSLQQASVVGAQFWSAALAAINPNAPAHLPALSQRELALPQAHSSFDGTQEFAFRHHLLHQVTYGTVLKPDKREGHRQAALWLQARSLGREAEVASQIAEHFERAGIADQAVRYWLLAADKASSRQADGAALMHADRGLALDDGSDLRRTAQLHRVRMDVFIRTGRMEEHSRTVDVLAGLAERLDDDVLRLLLVKDQIYVLCLAARFEEAVALGSTRLAAAEASSPSDAARANNLMFIALSRLGRFDEAMVHADKGLMQARDAGDRMTEGAVLNNVATNHLDARRMDQARSLYGDALQAYDKANSSYGSCTVHLNLAVMDERLGRTAMARDALLRLLPDCQAIGHRLLECQVHTNLAQVLIYLGDHQQAYDSAWRGLKLARAVGARLVQAEALSNVCEAAEALGVLPEALDCARQANEGFKLHGQHTNAWDQWASAISIRNALGEHAQALDEVAPLLQDVADQGGWGGCIAARTLLHELLAPLGDPRAEGLLAGAYAALQAEAAELAEFVDPDAYMHATPSRRRLCALWASAPR